MANDIILQISVRRAPDDRLVVAIDKRPEGRAEFADALGELTAVCAKMAIREVKQFNRELYGIGRGKE